MTSEELCRHGAWENSTCVCASQYAGENCDLPSVGGAVPTFCLLCVLLLLGMLGRFYVPCVQYLYLPSSVVGGIIGLFLRQLLEAKVDAETGETSGVMSRGWFTGWSDLASFLINIVFASLFLGVHLPRVSTVWKRCGPQLMYGMVHGWGLQALCSIVFLVVMKPIYPDLPPLYARLVQVGFSGGHGTAAGLKDSFITNGMPDGSGEAVAMAYATIGLVLSIVAGVLVVNVAIAKGWCAKPVVKDPLAVKFSLRGIQQLGSRHSAGVATTSADSIDTLTFHMALTGTAMMIGYLVKLGMVWSGVEALATFPLFPLCMVGGIIVQWSVERFNYETKLVDAGMGDRIGGIALDFLVTGAIASVEPSGVGENVVPFVVFGLVGLLWAIFMVPMAWKLLPNSYFERAICEFGQNLGVLASGLILLRIVDPESKSPVPADFAYKQLLHSPFMGGGVWTVASIGLTHSIGNEGILAISLVVIAIWLLLWWFHFRPHYEKGSPELGDDVGDPNYVALGDGKDPSVELRKN